MKNRRSIPLTAIVLAISASIPTAATDVVCDDGQRPWSWIGVNTFQCPGGTCLSYRVSVSTTNNPNVRVSVRGRSGPLGYDFSTEPRLRAMWAMIKPSRTMPDTA